MSLVLQLMTFPTWEMVVGIHRQQTRIGHHGLKEEWGEDERAKDVEQVLGLLALLVLCCRDQEGEEEVQWVMIQRMLYFLLPTVRSGSPTFEDRGLHQ